MALFTVREMLQACSEATQIENDRVCGLIKAERLVDATGTDEDAAYNRALDDVLEAVETEASHE
jgi:hypothetical protein